MPRETGYDRYLEYDLSATGVNKDAAFDHDNVWVTDASEGFVHAKVLRREGPSVAVKTDDGRELRVDTSARAAETRVEDQNPPYLDGVADMSQLTVLNESSVLHNLRVRYTASRIHTYSGLFLVVVNPYAQLPIYTPEITKMYEAKRRDEIAPHVFAVADEAYRSMLDTRTNQSILITGESGAGKTENTKKVIQYYATVCRRQDKFVGQLEEQMMQANPILEAFGNAKTLRNDNSSRFGKFIQVQFTKNGLVAGMKTVHYLLERSRICGRLQGERSFHIFYQLLAGANDAQRSSMKLGAPSTFDYLRAGECYEVDHVDDAAEFAATRRAMELFGVSAEQQEEIFRLVAAVLWLGNLKFEDNAKEEAAVTSREALENAAALLQVSSEALERAILKKRITAGGQTVVTHQRASMAAASRDALARALYDRLFDYIVRTINQMINHEGRADNFIGVLDIAGFEIFKTNSFEQLCINFTNEKLQQFFNHHMFVREQEEYAREQIAWQQQDFGMLLRDTIDLIERPSNGVFAMLDEQCILPAGKNDAFLQKLYNDFGRGCPVFTKPRTSSTEFTLKHYAGLVTYTVDDWLTKNKNPLHEDLVECIRQSRASLVQALFMAESAPAAAAAGVVGRGRKSVNLDTVAFQFRGQLNTLMSMLDSTAPHFPNPDKKSWVISPSLVLEQLRCNGVLEGIRISRLGYPLRVPFADFVKRFRPLAPANAVLPPQPDKAAAGILAATPLRNPEDYQLGKTKVFLRANVNATLEKLRNERIAVCAVRIQRAYRRHLFRVKYFRWRDEQKAATLIQRNTKAWLASKHRAWNQVYTSIKPLIKTSKIDEEMQELRNSQLQLKESLARAEHDRDEAQAAKRDREHRIEELDNELGRQAQRAKDTAEELNDTRQKLALAQSLAAQRQQQLEAQIDELDARAAGETEAKLRAQKEVLLLQAREQDLEGELSSTKDIVTLLEKTKAGLADQLAELQERVARLEEEVAALRKAKAKLEEDLAAARSALDNETRARTEAQRALQEAQADLGQAREDLNQAAQTKSRLERAVKQGEARIADLEAELETGSKDKTEIQRSASKQLDEVRSQLEEETGRLQKASQERDANAAELSATRTALNKEKSERERADREKADLKRQLDELTASLEAEQASRAAAEKAKAKTDANLKEVSDNLANEQSARDRLEKTKKQQDASLAEVSAARDAAVARATEAEARVRELEGAIENLGLQIEMDQKVKAQLTKGRDALEAKVSELQEQLEDLAGKEQSTAKSLVREQQLLKEQLSEESQARQRAEESARDAQAAVVRLTQQAASMVDKAKLEALDREAKSRDEARQTEIDELRSAKDKAEQALRKAKDAAAAAESSVADREARISRLESDLKSAKEQADRSASELQAALTQVEVAADKARKAESELSSLRSQTEEDATKSAQRLSKQRRDSEEQINELHEEIETLEAAVQKAESKARAAAAEAQEAIAAEQAKTAAASSARAALEKQVADLRAIVDAGGEKKVEEVKRAMQALVTQAQDDLAAAEAAAAKARSERDAAVRDSKAAHAQAEEAAAQNKSLNDRVSRAQSDAESADARAKAAEAALADAQVALQSARSEAEHLKSVVEDAESARQAATRKQRALEAELAQLNEELEEAEAAAAKRGRNAAQEAELEAKTQELDDALARLKTAEAAAAVATAERARAVQEAEEARAELTKLQRELRTVKNERDEAASDLELERSRSKENVSRLKRRNDEALAQATSDFEREKAARYELSKQVRLVQKELDDTRAQLRALVNLGK
eukprot:m51a1_g3071 putative myosin ii heavy chain (1786) ;mRNA; f:21639-27454